MEYSIYECLVLFIIYAFLGWCVEVIYHAVIKGKFINRGFEIGPLCPIYGFGALSVLLFLEPLKANWGLLFIASVCFTTLIELAAGFLLEKLFNEKWWDYSNEPFNFKGYICPRFSILWGLSCVIVVYVIHPTIIAMVRMIPEKLGVILTAALYIGFIADLTVTLINIMNIRKSLRAISEIERSLESLSVSIGTNLSEGTLAVMDKTEKLKEKLDDKQEELADTLETMQWELSDAKVKRQSKKQLVEDKRHAEYEEMQQKLKNHTEKVIKQSRRLRMAFPNIGSGRYEHLFRSEISDSSNNKDK